MVGAVAVPAVIMLQWSVMAQSMRERVAADEIRKSPECLGIGGSMPTIPQSYKRGSQQSHRTIWVVQDSRTETRIGAVGLEPTIPRL